MKKLILSFLLCLGLSAQAVNQAYYSSLDGKSGNELREALTQLLYTKHTTFVSYNWDFPYDYDSNGNMLDIYSSCGYNNHNTYPTSYKCCCDAVNREHVVCQSNFGGSSNNGKVPQYSDRHHLYPVDGRANGHRSDLPFGECSGGKHGTCNSASTIIPSEGTSTCANHEFGRSGASTFSVALPSGGGSVYEVGDEYKGDIARAILYMVVRYATKEYCRLPDGAKNASTALKTPNDYPVTAWANTTRDKVGQMFSPSLSTNHGLSDYGKALLLKWHRQDPVSQKEIDRNDGVESAQGNRNPFVDYPCLVEYLWGDYADQTVSLSSLIGSWETGFSGNGCCNSATPSIIRPTEDIDLGATSTGVAVTRSVIVQGANLTSGLNLSVTGTDASMFTLSQKSMSQSVATNGKAITVTYLPTASGNHTATLTISGGGLSSVHEVTLSGSCCAQYTLTLWRNGQQELLNCCGNYTLPKASDEADACEGWTFRGWATSAVAETTTKPAFVTTVNAAATLYAVYGHTVGSTTTYKTISCIAYTITLNDDEGIAEGGQYFASATSAQAGTTITLEAEPNDGYVFDGWRVSKADDPTTTVTVYFGAFEMPEYDVLVTGFFSAIPTYTATWFVNGNKYDSQTGLYYGDTPSLPDDPDDCAENRVFMGWTAQADYEDDADAPSDLFTTTAPAISQDTTFYAVFADKETGAGEGSKDTTIVVSSYADVSGEWGSFTVESKKNSGATNPAYNATDEDLRIYAKGTFSISCAEEMTTIVFNLSSQGKKRLAPITASTGAIATQSTGDVKVTWAGKATSVSFTVGDKADYGSDGSTKAGQLCFTSIDVTRGTDPETIYSNYSLYCSKAEYTVTFLSQGASHAVRTGHTGETFEPVTEPTACEGYTFIGWSTQQYAVGNTSLPTLDYTGRVPAANTTYYAVFSHASSAEAMTDNYLRITNTADLTTGNYVIAADTTNGYFALSTTLKDKYYYAGLEVTPDEDEVIAEPEAGIIWTITVNGELAKISHATAGNLYVEQSGKYYNIKIGDNTTDNAFTYSVSAGSWTFRSVSYDTQVLEYYISGSRWAFYKAPDAPIYLYKQQANSEITFTYSTAPSCGSTPTAIEETNANAKAAKFLRNGQLLIRRDGRTFTVLGSEVR